MPRSTKKGKAAPLHFEPTAYIQRLLGRELISNESIALAELVKNAYDAGANQVTITLYKDPKQKMVVIDNGNGMSLPQFKRLWMRPGYSEKTDRDPKSKRTLLGEKGIGRFAADKLAKKLALRDSKLRLADAHFKIGAYFSERKNRELATRHWQKAQELNPDSWNYHRQDWSFDKSKEMSNFLSKVRALNGRPYYDAVEFPAEAPAEKPQK